MGIWIAIAVGAAGIACWQHALRPRWYAVFCFVVAAIAAVSIIDLVNEGTDGTLAGIGFAVGVLLFLGMSSVLLVREAGRRRTVVFRR